MFYLSLSILLEEIYLEQKEKSWNSVLFVDLKSVYEAFVSLAATSERVIGEQA